MNILKISTSFVWYISKWMRILFRVELNSDKRTNRNRELILWDSEIKHVVNQAYREQIATDINTDC